MLAHPGLHNIVLPFILLLSWTELAIAQTPTRAIDARPVCEGCRIVFDTVAVVGALEDSVLIGDRPGGIVVGDGDTIVIGGSFLSEKTLVFAPDGQLIRTIASTGQGPGEIWRQIGIARYDGHRVLLLQVGRLSLVDLSGRVEEERRVALKSVYELEAAPDGRILYSHPENTPDVAGLRYQIFGPDLELVDAFGLIPQEEYSLCTQCRVRSTDWSRVHPGHFWSVTRRAYRIERWTDEGEQVETLEVVDSDWIGTEQSADRPSEMERRGGIRLDARRPTELQPPRILDVDEGPKGNLWVSGFAVPEDWRPLPGGIPPGPPTSYPPDIQEWMDRRWDTVIEVIDPVDGEVVATRRLLHEQALPTNGLHFYIKRQDDIGVVSYVVLEARLVGPR